MKRAIALMVLTGAATMLAAVGCAKKGQDVPTNEAVTDVTVPQNNYTPPAPQPVAQPVTYDSAPAYAANNTGGTSGMAGGSIASAGGGTTYTVKRGDTLYGIARTKYGDGKQWQKICSANPGLRPDSLRVGQTITLP